MRNSALIFLVLLLPVMVAACSDTREVVDELPNSSIAGVRPDDRVESTPDTSVTRAVRIGEDGPNMDACGGYGLVRNLPARGELDIRAAPFVQAKVIDTLVNGDTVFICSRSLDQKWMGVVVVPKSAEAASGTMTTATNVSAEEAPDCGVSSPVATKRDYDGPCVSGWVSSSYIRLIAG